MTIKKSQKRMELHLKKIAEGQEKTNAILSLKKIAEQQELFFTQLLQFMRNTKRVRRKVNKKTKIIYD